jgi:molybdopterin/thiamine biosynthesis adenylyltransferase
MPGKFHHETLYRGAERLAPLANVSVTVCGAGALGSHLAENLARHGFQHLRVIDKDRIEEHNVGTQIYGAGEIGGWKVDVLRNRLFRGVGLEIEAMQKELTEKNARGLLRGSDLVVDTFDNSASRRAVQDMVRTLNVPCLHVGLAADYAEIIWDERYRVPEQNGVDVCDYPLARNLILLAVAVASETILRFFLDHVRQDWSVTLGDFAVRPIPTA